MDHPHDIEISAVIPKIVEALRQNNYQMTPTLQAYIINLFEDDRGELLTQQIQADENKNKSALWFLSGLAYQNFPGYPELFIKIWDKYKNIITLECLTLEAAAENEAKISALAFLMKCAIEKNTLRPIINEMISYRPDIVIYIENNKKLIDLINNLTDNWGQGIQAIFKNRKNFFILREELKHKEIQFFTDNILIMIDEFAKKAELAGYHNAFYDIGGILLKQGLEEQALIAYKKTPNSASQYHHAMDIITATLYGKAISTNLECQRIPLLRDALVFALKTSDEVRFDYIQKIASSFIHNNYKNKNGIGPFNLIDNDWLDTMHADSDPEWCWRRIEEMKSKIQLEEKMEFLTAKLAVLELEKKITTMSNPVHYNPISVNNLDSILTPNPSLLFNFDKLQIASSNNNTNTKQTAESTNIFQI